MTTVDQVDKKSLQDLAGAVLSAVFIAAIPVVLAVTNIQLAFNSLPLYEYSYEKYQVSSYTGIPTSDLIRASKQMIEFFNSREGFPEIKALKGGQNSELFNNRETTHLTDVRDLLNRFMAFRNAAVIYAAVFALSAIFLHKREGVLLVSSGVIRSGVITLLGLLFFAGASLLGFDQIFVEFHRLSFSNNLWQLNPSTDYLLMMFPNGFWFDAAMLVGLSTAIEVTTLILISLFVRRLLDSTMLD